MTLHGYFAAGTRKVFQLLLLVSIAGLCSPAPAAAQFVTTSSIGGTVTDESGGVLPGVTVTLTSTALQLPALVVTTDTAGRYRFADRRAGVYQLRFELAGFQPAIRNALQVTAGFAARVDAVLKVGALQETITVSGASPVVDVKTTSGGQTLSAEAVNQLLPTSKMQADMARLTPGLIATSAPNIGRIGQGSVGGFTAYGTSGYTIMIDGFETWSNTYPDFSSAQEIDVRSFGNTAEQTVPGVVFNLITKSGGNEFHGLFAEQYINGSLQSSNLDNALRAQGLTFGDSVRYFSDFNSDLGGRIIRNKLWFYGTFRDRRNKRSVAGLVRSPGPDGQYGTGDEPPHQPPISTRNWVGKMSYQPSPKYQLVATFARDYSINDGGNVAKGPPRFVPYESNSIMTINPTTWHGELRATLTNTMLFTSQVGRVSYFVDYQDTPGNDTITARWDRETQFFTGGSVAQPGGSYAETKRPRQYWLAQGSLTATPQTWLGGGHDFKVGYRLFFLQGGSNSPNHAAGNYQLTYDRVNGVPHQPVEIQTFNFPVFQKNHADHLSGYANDHWTLGARLTLNLGLRWEYQHAFVPEQTKEQGQFGSSGTFTRFDAETWKTFAPRAALAFDLTGDGKSVVKTTYGWYNDAMDDFFPAPYNKNGSVVTTYRWRDLYGRNDYTPGEVNLDPNGPDFISITGSANNIFNPDLRASHQHEMTASLDRELRPNMSARVLYVYKRNADAISTVNVLRPYTTFNIQLSRRDPGPDGVLNTGDDGGRVTIYDYDPAFRGRAFVGNERLNRPAGRSDHYNTLELTVNKRITNRGGFLSSYAATKNHRWLVGIPTSPNDDYFPLDTTWNWIYKITGSYRFPYDFVVSGLFDVQNGARGQRTYTFRATDPDGGVPLRQQTTVTLRLEPFGSQRQKVRSGANIRFSKFQRFKKGEMQLSLDLLNAFNSNPVWGSDYQSGPTFGYATTIADPRAVSFGASYRF